MIRQKLKFAFLNQGGDTFIVGDWINRIWKGSSKTRFQYCQNSCSLLLYIRAIQGNTGENLIKPELMGHVAILFLFEAIPISPRMLIQFGVNLGGWAHCREKESRKGRQTVFITLLDPLKGGRKICKVTFQSQEKYTTRLSGNILKPPSSGSIWPRHKKKA